MANNCYTIIDKCSTQFNWTQLNWVKGDNEYWSVPPYHPPTHKELLGHFQMTKDREIWGVT